MNAYKRLALYRLQAPVYSVGISPEYQKIASRDSPSFQLVPLYRIPANEEVTGNHDPECRLQPYGIERAQPSIEQG